MDIYIYYMDSNFVYTYNIYIHKFSSVYLIAFACNIPALFCYVCKKLSFTIIAHQLKYKFSPLLYKHWPEVDSHYF